MMADWEDAVDGPSGNWEDVDSPEDPGKLSPDYQWPREPMSKGSTAIEALADAIPGTGVLGATINTIPDVVNNIQNAMASQPTRNIVDAWHEHKAEQEARSKLAQQDNPWTYGLTNVAGAIGGAVGLTASAPAAAMKVAPAIYDAVSSSKEAKIMADFFANVGMSAGQSSNTGEEAIGGDVGSQAIGAGIGGAIKTLGRPLRSAAGAMQVPQRMVEYLAEKSGKAGKLLSAGESDLPSGQMASARVRALRKQIADADSFKGSTDNFAELEPTVVSKEGDLAYRMGRAAHAGEATIGDGTSFTATPKAGVYADIHQLGQAATDQAAEKQWPGSSNSENPFVNKIDEADQLLEQSLRKTNIDKQAAADIASAKAANGVETNANRSPVKPAHGPQEAPKTYMRGPNVKNKGEYTGPDYSRRIDRDENFVDHYKEAPVDQGDPEHFAEKGSEEARRYAGAQNRNAVHYDSRAERAQKAAKQQTGASASSMLDDAASIIGKVGEGAEQATTARKSAVGDMLGDARKWLEKIATSEREAETVAAGNLMEKARLQGVAAQARQELQKIGVGRQAIKNTAGALEGMGSGATFGVGGAVLGAAVGKKLDLGGATLKGIDFAGAVGQRLGEADIPSIAAKAEQWATRSDALGRAAQWALSGQGDQAMIRMMTLANMPEAQAE